MLRELITYVLNNYLGKYIENLNTQQLLISLLNGEVELENLPLRRDALRNIGLPLKILCGSVGKIKLQVPVRQFRTAPWCINIENVIVVCGPINLDDWDAAEEEQADLDFKLAGLDRLEAKWRAERETVLEGGYYASSYSGWLSYGTSLVTNIVENLQLKINNVHIRYEDSVTIENQRFACGFTIESLSAQSCDINWMPGYTANVNQSQLSYKLVELQSFSFYWDSLANDEVLGALNSHDLAEAMEKLKQTWQHNYVISPVSATARLKRDRSEVPLRTRSRPRLVCDLLWNEISLTLSDTQYGQIVGCTRGLDDIARYRRYRLLRPRHSVKEGPKAWWLYFIRCHGYLRTDKEKLNVIAKENLQYIRVCTKILLNPNIVLAAEEKDLKEHFERDRDYEDLKFLRELCLFSMPNDDVKIKTEEKKNQGRSMLVHWFPQWWYGGGEKESDSSQNQNTAVSAADPNTIEDELLNALSDTVENNSILKRDAVFGKFEFTLKKGTFDVCSNKTPMLQLQFENLILNVETRPRSGSHFVGLSLGSICIRDRITVNSEFPDLIKPQQKDDRNHHIRNPTAAQKLTRLVTQNQGSSQSATNSATNTAEPLFLLEYEQKPLTCNTDYRLLIKSQSLDIVYNTGALAWIMDFITKPHQMINAKKKIEDMKNKTKAEFIKNWENILDGHLSERKIWTLEIDISAPQIIFVENFCDKNDSLIVVIDFGRLQLTNEYAKLMKKSSDAEEFSQDLSDNNDDDEAFMTPCSTPPGSPSISDSPTLCSALSDLPDTLNHTNFEQLNEGTLHNKLYDRYNVDLTDLQVLVCRAKERWGFASAKGYSTMHVLDRFCISLQIERRIINTLDPQFPSLTLSGTLPKLNAHVNEQKISALLHIFHNVVSNSGSSDSPFSSPSDKKIISSDTENPEQTDQPVLPEESPKEYTKIVFLQFAIDQLSLEVQSRGRSIAELQVTGVKAGYSQRAIETNFTLSVHGLLLVDAMQSFGPDFELLVASHKHVGMDSVSGSLRQSEPVSPCSPGSPDPHEMRRPTSPLSITKALSSLQRANSSILSAASYAGDLDALITVEVIFISPTDDDGEKLQIANIQFNNLDIIANQETIVELLTFVQRVFPKMQTKPASATSRVNKSSTSDASTTGVHCVPLRTEITFDFHRLNILILRAVMRDSYLVGRKVGTFTMSEAKIHATLGSCINVEGSLGGLQVLDLTPDGVNHQRILSVGKDPLTDPPDSMSQPVEDLLTTLTNEIYGNNNGDGGRKGELKEDRQALSFNITRDLNASVTIKIRMASVWYTHCARFMQELSWCATEFKHYLKTLARSIRDKATDMALGLVQPLPNTPKTMEFMDTPKKTYTRQRTESLSKSRMYAPRANNVTISLDIILDTPVLVLPRSSASPQVFVAHLGKMTLKNNNDVNVTKTNSNLTTPTDTTANSWRETLNEKHTTNVDDRDETDFRFVNQMDDADSLFTLDDSFIDLSEESTKENVSVEQQPQNLDLYIINIRNINLFSLDTTNRKGFRLSALPRAEEFYSCQEDAIPVIHDTAIKLEIERHLSHLWQDSHNIKEQINVNGSVIKPLRLSLTRQQYEQLLDTIDNIFKIPADLTRPPTVPTEVISTSEDDATTISFKMDPKVKRRLFSQESLAESKDFVAMKIFFELPTFIIELNNQKQEPLIEISFRDFIVCYDKHHVYETKIKVSLKSLLMEDLLRSVDSKHRIMVISSAQDNKAYRIRNPFISNSCPDLVNFLTNSEVASSSLPDNLNRKKVNIFENKNRTICPDTPPPSPQPKTNQENLVIYTSELVDPNCPNFKSHYNSMRQTSFIDFNSLDLVVSVESWFVLLNFFGLLSDNGDADDEQKQKIDANLPVEAELKVGNTELNISVRSLTLVLIKPSYELAKANVSNAHFIVSKYGPAKTVDGRLGSISLVDLTTHGSVYRERFMTSGNEALNFMYTHDAQSKTAALLKEDAKLRIQMSSVRFIYTKRYISEIQEFFREFSQLQMPVIKRLKTSDSKQNLQQKPTHLLLEIKASSPIILLPLSSKSDSIIVADLGEFTLKNSFHFSNESGIISIRKDTTGPIEILDVMMVKLFHTDLFAGLRCLKSTADGKNNNKLDNICLDMGNYVVLKKGDGLLKHKCHLKLIVERNIDSWRTHNVPDISVHGTLSKLESVLDLQQYKLVRGFLAHNLGEALDDLSVTALDAADSRLSLATIDAEKLKYSQVWKNLSIALDLQDVSVRLDLPKKDVGNAKLIDLLLDNSALACINFIKSSLIIDSFSDGSQDIDLVSQEILILDSRTHKKDEQKNVFTNILKPIHTKASDDIVQAEVHSRKRKDHTKYTILLNDMRVMAVLDWLEAVKDFLAQSEDPPPSTEQYLAVPMATSSSHSASRSASDINAQLDNAIELKLNITDSEVVFLENTNQKDTNAIILKSTTVLSYRPFETNKVMSINLNNLEVFSCALDAEEETALSIIDPVTINLDIKKGILEVHMQKQLCIRLSYNDVRLMQTMWQSLQWQSEKASNSKFAGAAAIPSQNYNYLVSKLTSLGFRESDCLMALAICDQEIDDAAIWLTQNAEPTNKVVASKSNNAISNGPLDIIAVDVKASCISVCVIDDCKDADVPLLEFSLSHLNLRQELGGGGTLTTDTLNVLKDSLQQEAAGRSGALAMSSFKAGHLSGVFASDYYNRALSGWEPISEPWKCEAAWSYSFGQSGVKRNRLHLKIDSLDTLRLNLTSTLIELYELVKENWIQDYYAATASPVSSHKTSNTVNTNILRRRSPFVPFALKNETGITLWFTTLVSSADGVSRSGEVISHAITDPTWQSVNPGAVTDFTFGKTLNKKRHHDSHKLNLHQINVHVDGWQVVGPISVDKVGVFFRHAKSEFGNEYSPLPRARIVFAVTLEGAAQKLITVRSALKLYNKLDNPVLLKMEHLFGHLNIRDWPDPKSEIVNSAQVYSVPLSHVHAFLYVKPLQSINLEEPLGSSSSTVTDTTSLQKFDGSEYWNKYENFESSRSSFRINNNYQFTDKSIHWKEMIDHSEVQQELRTCRGNRDKSYRLVVAIRKDGYPSKDGLAIPGHTLTLFPPLRLHNLLPCDLLYKIPGTGTKGRISSAKTATLNEIDLEQPTELNVTLDSYPVAGQIHIPQGCVGTFEADLRLADVNKRVLLLKASIQVLKSSGIQITISAPFWLINRTGLPLVFRQEGVPYESAGQFSENEQARQVSPFMYSFSDPDGSPALIVRLGKRYGVNPPWCQPFNLHKDILHRQLKSSSTNETFIIGIEVRRGRGRYSQTTIVTFSPRFQLYNQSSYKIQIAQKCFARMVSDAVANTTFIEVVPGCHLPFHWPRLDKDQELCIRLPGVEDCMWSGGIPIQETQSLYINIRNMNGAMNFLRMEIVLQGATYYMLFGNAEVLPPPIRLDNFSEVPIQFYQPGCKHELKTVVRPHASMSYVLDEPMGLQCLQVEAPGGDTFKCVLGGFEDIRLTYENFIYIAFSHTFESIPSYGLDGNEYDVKSQQLVLGVVENKVVLVRKQAGDRSQLWRMNNAKQLEHEGSSPPIEPGKKYSRFVLDLEKPPQPTQNICLVVRPANLQRKTTQTWRFTEQGRLMCEHSSLCVQAQGGFFGLRPGSDAVLGMIKSDARVLNQLNVPFEQAIERQKLRPGSGCLSVAFQMDGPIKTIQIKDVKNLASTSLTLDATWKHVSHILTADERNQYHSQSETGLQKEKKLNEYHINLNLSKGIGLSVISRSPCEELIYVTFENILLEFIATASIRSLDLSVGDLQIDNQLFETQCPVMLYTIRSTYSESPLSALQLNVKMLPSPNTNAVIFEHLILSLRPMALYLEERLMLRLADFLGFGKSMIDPAALPDESDYEAQRVVAKVLATNAIRYYFGNMQIVPSQIRLSVITASKLSGKLTEIKKSLGLTLIKFEDAIINFNTYSDKHHFETLEAYLCSIKNHYKNELKWQAAYILGSVDFLGNPIGFANDLSEGFTGLFIDGSITSLVKNVTHGISNSTAKLTETLSDGLGRVVLDEQYTETRQRILEVTNSASSTGDHLVAGLKGFGYGLLGGVTSLVKHTYNGAQADGFQGFISGLGRGLVGTVTKPVIGVLDLASETANAVKETSKSSSRILPDRKRPPRCVTGAPGGLLPPFSTLQSKGQQHLFLINKRNFNEQFMAYEPCLFDNKDSQLRLLVSTENVWVFSRTEDTTTVIFSYHLSELLSCHPVSVYPENTRSKKLHHYIELCLTLPSKSLTPSAPEMVKRPRVRCQSEETAQKASRHINYAKGVYDEREQTLISDTVID